MKTLISLAMVSIAMYGCATSSSVKSYGPYDVVGVGDTCDKARDFAFRTAVEQAFGTAVMGEKQMKNDVLTRDDVLSHSSGFIDEFKINETSQNKYGCTVRLTASVKPSMVNQYIFNNPTTSIETNGEKIHTQVSTYMDERTDSDATIRALFRDYVSRAYVLKQYPAKYEIDSRRTTVMQIPFEITMNDDFVKKVNYTLDKLQQKCSGNCSMKPKYMVRYIPEGSVIPKWNTYFFNDMQTPELIDSLLRGECNFTYKVETTIYDINGKVLHNQINVPHHEYANIPRMTDDNGWGYGLNTTFWVFTGVVEIPFDSFSAQSMKRVEIKILDTSKKIKGMCS